MCRFIAAEVNAYIDTVDNICAVLCFRYIGISYRISFRLIRVNPIYKALRRDTFTKNITLIPYGIDVVAAFYFLSALVRKGKIIVNCKMLIEIAARIIADPFVNIICVYRMLRRTWV